jgi:hypothetical protein
LLLEVSELPITSPLLTEAELLAQKERLAPRKKEKQKDIKRPTNFKMARRREATAILTTL